MPQFTTVHLHNARRTETVATCADSVTTGQGLAAIHPADLRIGRNDSEQQSGKHVRPLQENTVSVHTTQLVCAPQPIPNIWYVKFNSQLLVLMLPRVRANRSILYLAGMLLIARRFFKAS